MRSDRRRPATVAAALATMTRDVRRAVRAADPDRAPGLVPLRDTGWQLIQPTGELTDLVAVLAEHTGHHTGQVGVIAWRDVVAPGGVECVDGRGVVRPRASSSRWRSSRCPSSCMPICGCVRRADRGTAADQREDDHPRSSVRTRRS
jgi:hypothetical protein